GASRLVSGTSDLHRCLEASLARLKGCEDAIVFSSGYLANAGTIPALAGRQDAVFSDELHHAGIIDGCRLSGARIVVYRHVDVAGLEQALCSVDARRRLVVTVTVFSMQGDLAPLPDIARACERHGAMLLVDDAHATGLLVGDGPEAMALSSRLLEHGVFVPAIRPPSVPAGTARLRVTVTASHTEEHLAAAVEAFASVRRGVPRQPNRQPPSGGIDPRILG